MNLHVVRSCSCQQNLRYNRGSCRSQLLPKLGHLLSLKLHVGCHSQAPSPCPSCPALWLSLVIPRTVGTSPSGHRAPVAMTRGMSPTASRATLAFLISSTSLTFLSGPCLDFLNSGTKPYSFPPLAFFKLPLLLLSHHQENNFQQVTSKFQMFQFVLVSKLKLH